MRRLILLAAVLLMLAGCGADSPPPVSESSPTSVSESSAAEATSEPSASATPMNYPGTDVTASYLAATSVSIGQAAGFVEAVRLVASSAAIVPNLVIISTWLPGDEDPNLVETLCAGGQLWGAQNQPEGLSISVAPVDYSTSFTSCSL